MRLSAIGDTTHVVPIVRTLQRYWPQCKITWIIGKAEYGLLQNLDGIEFIIFDKQSGRQGLKNFRQTMKQRSFDVLLHMQAALRASFLARSIRAPIKVGFDRTRAADYQWLFSTHKISATKNQHVLDGFFEFLATIGLKERVLQWNIPLAEEDRRWATTIIDSKKSLLLINPCSSVRRNNWRNWSEKNYAPVIDHATQHGMQVALTGGPANAEIAMANRIAADTPHAVINLVGKTNLQQLMALTERATIMIAPDTGPAHIATMFGVPVIGLFASSNPLRTGPYLSQQTAVNKYPAALEKFLGKSIDEVKWGKRIRKAEVMNLISPNDVNKKIDLIVNGPV